MAVSKDTEKGTWTSQIWVEDWQGKKKHKKKRGFASKKEALEWERNMLLASKTDADTPDNNEICRKKNNNNLNKKRKNHRNRFICGNRFVN